MYRNSCRWGGPLTHLVRATCEEMGVTCDIRYLPWPRAEKLTETGEFFATFPYARTKERTGRFHFSVNLYHTVTVFFLRRDRLELTGYSRLEDLLPHRIGGNIGYSYVPWLREAGLDPHLVTDQKQLLHLLTLDRIDIAALDQGAGWMLIRELYPDDAHLFITLPRPLEADQADTSNHLMVSRRYPGYIALTDQFNQALEMVRRDGRYRRILEDHHLTLSD